MKEERSVSAVVYHNKKYLLLKYGLGHWGFVKGHIEEGESNEETIMRELYEETGITDADIIKGFKEKYDYFFNFQSERIHKYVDCYLIKSNTEEVILSYEHDDYVWLPLKEAVKRATFKNTKFLLKKANLYQRTTLDKYINKFS
ncbi:MAG: bis(5'-nucleosyl)-tetraphosphatase [Candidatus Hodarchaeota archaeon]